ncbi:MAG: hypothetical protein HUK15_06035 [Bacteroidales bacterium]|nr:hypothetical protein [Bacteroidales bacterium]
MKRIILLALFIGMLLLTGCFGNMQPRFDNDQQHVFDSICEVYCNWGCNAYDDYELGEVYREFDGRLYDFMRDVNVLCDWRAWISGIDISEVKGGVNIGFELRFVSPRYGREYCFVVSYEVDNEKLKKDYIYNQVMDLQDGENVYFSGIIRREQVGRLFSEDGHSLCEPVYMLWIIDIGRQPFGISWDLDETLWLAREVCDDMEARCNGVPGDDYEFTREERMHAKTFVSMAANLDKRNQGFVIRYNAAMQFDLMYMHDE